MLFSSVQSLSRVRLFVTSWTAAYGPPCPSPTSGVYSISCPSSQWCHPAISSSVIPFSSHLQSFPALGSFQKSQFFASGGQSIGVSASASVFLMNIQDQFPLRWTGWISLLSKGLLPRMLLEISGEITPERMKGWSQSKNNTQLWMWLVMEVKSDAIKCNVA